VAIQPPDNARSDAVAADVDVRFAVQVAHRLARHHLHTFIDQAIADLCCSDLSNVFLFARADRDDRDPIAAISSSVGLPMEWSPKAA
jgi:hypothetical protein